FFNSKYEFSEDFAQPVAEASEIKVMLRRGDIRVVPSPDDQAHAVINKAIRADSQSSADQMNSVTNPRFQQQGSIWIMDLTGSPYEHGTFDMELQLPRKAIVSLSTGRGDLNVSDRDSHVNLSTDNGDVTATGVKGNALVRMRSGSATVKDIGGNV